jgi:hypothetical protein
MIVHYQNHYCAFLAKKNAKISNIFEKKIEEILLKYLSTEHLPLSLMFPEDDVCSSSLKNE